MDKGKIIKYIILAIVFIFILLCWMQYKNPQDLSGLTEIDQRNKFGW